MFELKTVKEHAFAVYLFGRTSPVQTREKFFVCFNLNTLRQAPRESTTMSAPVALLAAPTTMTGPEEPLVAASFNALMQR